MKKAITTKYSQHTIVIEREDWSISVYDYETRRHHTRKVWRDTVGSDMYVQLNGHFAEVVTERQGVYSPWASMEYAEVTPEELAANAARIITHRNYNQSTSAYSFEELTTLNAYAIICRDADPQASINSNVSPLLELHITEPAAEATEATQELAAEPAADRATVSAMVEGISLDNFSTTTANEWGEAFGLIGLVEGSTAYQLITDNDAAKYVTIGYTEEWNEAGSWVCQIDNADCECVACYDGATPAEAMERAAAEATTAPALLDNDNCEDATNAAAYAAFALMHGSTDTIIPDTSEEWEQLDRLMGYARSHVKSLAPAYGIQWEEF